MATRTVSDAGGNWNAVGTWVEGVVPTEADDVVDTATSGALVINAAAYCRSIELAYCAVTHNSGITLVVGTTTIKDNNVAVSLLSSYTALGANASVISLRSTAPSGTMTLNFGTNLVSRLDLSGGNYDLLSDLTAVSSESYIYHTAGTFNTNNHAISTGMLWGTGTQARTLTFGSSIITLSRTGNPIIELASTGLTITANTAIIIASGTYPRVNGGGNDFNGATLYIAGGAGTVLFGNSCTWKNFVFNVTGAKTLSVTAGVTITVTDLFANYSSYLVTLICGTASTYTISKATGAVILRNFDIQNATFTGGATFDAYHNCTNSGGVTGVTFHGGEWCLDFVNGDDADTTPYGWWKLTYTSPTGTVPEIGETVTSGAVTAEVSGPINPIDWARGQSGTLYVIKKTGTFTAGTITFSGGGSATISGDFTVTGWKTLTTGAPATRIAPGDIMKARKSPNPTLVDNASVWTTRPATPSSAVSITSSTNTTPIKITKAGHGLVSGDVVFIDGHTTNVSANGFWLVEYVDTDNFNLVNSVGVGVGGATGTFTKVNHLAVVLSEAHTKWISRCGDDGAWTGGSSNYTVTLNTPAQTSRKEGYYAIKVAVLAGAGANEKAAYFNTPTLNLSGYQQVSFWINSSIALNAGDLELRLCSDDAGATAVHTIPIPKIVNTGTWLRVVYDFGVNLSNAIESVALYQIVDKGAFQVYLDEIIACKAASAADSLTHASLFSKSSSAYNNAEAFYTIQCFGSDGRVLVFENKYNEMFYQKPAYFGTPETVPLYKREVLTITAGGVAAYNTKVNEILDSGTAALPIRIKGGYDPVTGQQDGETYYGSDGFGTLFYATGKNYYEISRISAVRCYQGYNLNNGTGITLKDIDGCIQTTTNSIYFGTVTFGVVDNIGSIIGYADGFHLASCTDFEIGAIRRIDGGLVSKNNGLYLDSCQRIHFNGLIGHIGMTHSQGIAIVSSHECRFSHIGTIEATQSNGIYLSGAWRNVFDLIDNILYSTAYHGIHLVDSGDNEFRGIGTIDGSVRDAIRLEDALYNTLIGKSGCYLQNSTNYAIYFLNRSFENRFFNLKTRDNALGSIYALYQRATFRNCEFADVVFVASTPTAHRGLWLAFEKHNTVADYHYIYTEGGAIYTDAITRHTEADVSWAFTPTSTVRGTDFPIVLKLAELPVTAGSITFRVWCKKTHATDIAAKLVIKGGQLSGVASLIESVAPDSTEWTQLEITAVPAEAGVLCIEAHVWWVANAADEIVYFDDMSWE